MVDLMILDYLRVWSSGGNRGRKLLSLAPFHTPQSLKGLFNECVQKFVGGDVVCRF